LAPGVKLAPMMRGGGQERGRRGGTLNVPAIAGFGAAMLAASAQMEALTARHRELRARILAGIAECGAVLCGEGDGLANTLCLALPGVSSDAQLIALDLAGICVSSGSACSAGKVGDSHVLTAMGLGEFARSAIRVSMPWSVSDADVKGFCEAYRTLAARTAGCRV